MLVAFNVMNLTKWGYDESTLFINPMEPSFRPKNIDPAGFTNEAIRKKLDWFWGLNAYSRTVAEKESWPHDRPKMPYMR
jgi:bilirubin oxidase